MNTIVEDVMEERVATPLVIDPLECRKIIGRMFCEMPPTRCPTPPHHPFQAAETFTPDKWEYVLFELNDTPIGNDRELVKQVEEGLRTEDLPRTNEGITRLIAIWIFG
jgi:hypothetical protein